MAESPGDSEEVDDTLPSTTFSTTSAHATLSQPSSQSSTSLDASVDLKPPSENHESGYDSADAVQQLLQDSQHKQNDTISATNPSTAGYPPAPNLAAVQSNANDSNPPKKAVAAAADVIELLDSDDDQASSPLPAPKRPRLEVAPSNTPTLPTPVSLASYHARNQHFATAPYPPQAPARPPTNAYQHNPNYFDTPHYMRFPEGFRPTWNRLIPPPKEVPPIAQRFLSNPTAAVFRLSLLNVNENLPSPPCHPRVLRNSASPFDKSPRNTASLSTNAATRIRPASGEFHLVRTTSSLST